MARLLYVILWGWCGLGLSASWAEEKYNKWNKIDDPANFDSNYEYRLSALPMKATLPADRIPWSESYWPRNKGSINIRWNAPGTPGFGNIPPPRSQVRAMSLAQLAQLSPAEKYDLILGHYDYPFARSIAGGPADERAKDYEGLCDGWTATAMQFREPLPVNIVNPDGVTIPLGSSDVKALMAWYTSFYAELEPIFVGSYCFGSLGIRMNNSRCADINPGSYHVVLANEIGLKRQPFAADVDIGKETWNQPVYGYEFQVVGSAKSDAFRALQIHAKMFYTDELDQSSWYPVSGTPNFIGAVQETDYILELDQSGRIQGGSWISKYTHPDLFWKPTKKVIFKDDFEIINRIYKPM